MTKYGCTLFVGVGVPIPVLNSEIAKSTSVSDSDIVTSVLDYSVPSRSRPSLKDVTYEELRSGKIEINGQEVPTSSISSFRVAKRIAELLKKRISIGKFLLTSPVQRISSEIVCNVMDQREFYGTHSHDVIKPVPDNQLVYRDTERCVECGFCIPYCPSGVYTQDANGAVRDDVSVCTGCGACSDICPQRAITVRV